jgi:hypothetical protein
MRVWLDGQCIKCGALVVKMSSNVSEYTYMNTCLNKKCKEHKWHFTNNGDKLDYYEQDATILRRIKIGKGKK